MRTKSSSRPWNKFFLPWFFLGGLYTTSKGFVKNSSETGFDHLTKISETKIEIFIHVPGTSQNRQIWYLLFFVFLCFRWSRGPSFNRLSIFRRPNNSEACFSFLFPFVDLGMSLFPNISIFLLCTIAVFSLHLPCDHGLIFYFYFRYQLMWEFNQSTNKWTPSRKSGGIP